MDKQRFIFDPDIYNEKMDQDAIDWVEVQFPKEFYGDDILMYETWPMRALLEQAYMAGKEFKNAK